MFDGKKAQIFEAVKRRYVGHLVGGNHKASEPGVACEGREAGDGAALQFEHFELGEVSQRLQVVNC